MVNFLNCLKGRVLGRGSFRTVYELRDLENNNGAYIIKVAHDNNGHTQNAMEFEVWGNASKKLKRWLCPNIMVSRDGLYLVCRRAEPLQKKQKLKAVPAIFGDTHKDNWMLYNGKIVCVDYSILNIGHPNPYKMVKTWGWDG